MSISPQKPCPRCQKLLDPEDYARDASKASRHESFCKSCDNARSRRYYAQHREAVIRRVRRAQVRRAERERAA